MMSAENVVFAGVSYIPSRLAAQKSGYSQDYIGQLARAGEIDGRRIGGLWYVHLESIEKHKEAAEAYTPVPPIRAHEHAATSAGEIVSFDGKQFVSSRKAAEITGYSQDYVGQLARGEEIISRRIGNRWYVEKVSLIAHKRHNDELLAAVQAQSVGLNNPQRVTVGNELRAQTDTRYFREEKDLMPRLREKAPNTAAYQDSKRDHSATHTIPVHIQKTPKMPLHKPQRIDRGEEYTHPPVPLTGVMRHHKHGNNYPPAPVRSHIWGIFGTLGVTVVLAAFAASMIAPYGSQIIKKLPFLENMHTWVAEKTEAIMTIEHTYESADR